MDSAAQAVAGRVGVDDVMAELLPQDKVQSVQGLKAVHGVAMVGDGVNDAPALATATVGIAMGGAGTDTALETADVVLMSDDLSKLPFALDLSRATLRIIKQNIYFAIAIEIVAVLAVFPGWLTLWLAILADMGATVIVTLNGMRLLAHGGSMRRVTHGGDHTGAHHSYGVYVEPRIVRSQYARVQASSTGNRIEHCTDALRADPAPVSVQLHAGGTGISHGVGESRVRLSIRCEARGIIALHEPDDGGPVAFIDGIDELSRGGTRLARSGRRETAPSRLPPNCTTSSRQGTAAPSRRPPST